MSTQRMHSPLDSIRLAFLGFEWRSIQPVQTTERASALNEDTRSGRPLVCQARPKRENDLKSFSLLFLENS